MFSSSTEFKICGNMVPAVGRNLLSARDHPTPAGSLNNIHLTRVMTVYIKWKFMKEPIFRNPSNESYHKSHQLIWILDIMTFATAYIRFTYVRYWSYIIWSLFNAVDITPETLALYDVLDQLLTFVII